jgi:hypothetical protein
MRIHELGDKTITETLDHVATFEDRDEAASWVGAWMIMHGAVCAMSCPEFQEGVATVRDLPDEHPRKESARFFTEQRRKGLESFQRYTIERDERTVELLKDVILTDKQTEAFETMVLFIKERRRQQAA